MVFTEEISGEGWTEVDSPADLERASTPGGRLAHCYLVAAPLPRSSADDRSHEMESATLSTSWPPRRSGMVTTVAAIPVCADSLRTPSARPQHPERVARHRAPAASPMTRIGFLRSSSTCFQMFTISRPRGVRNANRLQPQKRPSLNLSTVRRVPGYTPRTSSYGASATATSPPRASASARKWRTISGRSSA